MLGPVTWRLQRPPFSRSPGASSSRPGAAKMGNRGEQVCPTPEQGVGNSKEPYHGPCAGVGACVSVAGVRMMRQLVRGAVTVWTRTLRRIHDPGRFERVIVGRSGVRSYSPPLTCPGREARLGRGLATDHRLASIPSIGAPLGEAWNPTVV